MEYCEILEAIKSEVSEATAIEECYLIIHEYYGMLMELYAQVAEQNVLDGEDDLPF